MKQYSKIPTYTNKVVHAVDKILLHCINLLLYQSFAQDYLKSPLEYAKHPLYKQQQYFVLAF